MEKQIWSFEQFFHTISNYAKVGYARYNLSTQKGYAIQQYIIGKYDNVHPDDRKKLLDYYRTIDKNSLNAFQTEVRVLRPGTTDNWNLICKNIIATSNFLYSYRQGTFVASINKLPYQC